MASSTWNIDGEQEEEWIEDYTLPSRTPHYRPEPEGDQAVGAQWGYQKLAMLIEYIEEHCELGSPDSVMSTIEAFGTGVGQWVKVAGGIKAPLIESAQAGRRPKAGEVSVEFGTFIGYTAIRMARNMMLHHGGRGKKSPYKIPRIITLEVDPIHAFVSRHIIDLAMVLCYLEVWTGQIKDVIPRVQEVWGERALAFGFMDYKGSRYHADFQRWEQLDILAPFGRLVADNTVSPGAPLLLWNLRHNTGTSMTLWALPEFLEEAIEDWMVVFDYEIPCWGPREPDPMLVEEDRLTALEAQWEAEEEERRNKGLPPRDWDPDWWVDDEGRWRYEPGGGVKQKEDWEAWEAAEKSAAASKPPEDKRDSESGKGKDKWSHDGQSGKRNDWWSHDGSWDNAW